MLIQKGSLQKGECFWHLPFMQVFVSRLAFKAWKNPEKSRSHFLESTGILATQIQK